MPFALKLTSGDRVDDDGLVSLLGGDLRLAWGELWQCFDVLFGYRNRSILIALPAADIPNGAGARLAAVGLRGEVVEMQHGSESIDATAFSVEEVANRGAALTKLFWDHHLDLPGGEYSVIGGRTRRAAERQIRLRPDNDKDHRCMAAILAADGELDAAIRHAELAIEHSQTFANTKLGRRRLVFMHYFAGCLLWFAGHPDDAVREWRTAGAMAQLEPGTEAIGTAAARAIGEHPCHPT